MEATKAILQLMMYLSPPAVMLTMGQLYHHLFELLLRNQGANQENSSMYIALIVVVLECVRSDLMALTFSSCHVSTHWGSVILYGSVFCSQLFATQIFCPASALQSNIQISGNCF